MKKHVNNYLDCLQNKEQEENSYLQTSEVILQEECLQEEKYVTRERERGVGEALPKKGKQKCLI